ncbi:Aminopeptidase P [Fragilaria crotonensis]|nr:Aminopeptidase P [Fragilaria crotonensis]
MSSFLSLGDNYKISLQEVFAKNRQKLWEELKLSSACGDKSDDDVCVEFVVYLQGGAAETRFDSDHEPIFRQESYFLWLTGVQEPDCAVMMTANKTTLFIPRLPASYATIMGHIKTPDEWKTIYQVDCVEYLDMLEQTLLKQCEEIHNAGAKCKLLLMEGDNSDSGSRYKPPELPFLQHLLIEAANSDSNVSSSNETAVSDTLNGTLLVDTTTLFPILANCRVLKSEAELHLLRHVTEVTSFAHVYVMRNTKPNLYEYQCESLFRHYCYYNYACRLVAYTPICGCGPNGAILHYGHVGEPNSRLIQDSDMCLFDMGAEYFGYGSDVTCSFPASGTFTEQQRGIWEAVVTAQRAVYAMLKPGVSWLDCHKAAELAILQALVDIGVVVLNSDGGGVSLEDLVELRFCAVFMPHGLGHFLGIDTHDVGGYLPGHPERIQQPGLKSLRTARILEESMVLTVEPGCYFIDHLLDEALASDFAQYLNAELLNDYRGFGGVRLEDVVTITDTGFINYTLCPRTVQEVEHVMAGGKWPPLHDEAPELGRQRLTDPNPMPSPPSL